MKREVEEWAPGASTVQKCSSRCGPSLLLKVRVQGLEEEPPNLTGGRDLDKDQTETTAQAGLGSRSSSQPPHPWKRQPALHFRQPSW